MSISHSNIFTSVNTYATFFQPYTATTFPSLRWQKQEAHQAVTLRLIGILGHSSQRLNTSGFVTFCRWSFCQLRCKTAKPWFKLVHRINVQQTEDYRFFAVTLSKQPEIWTKWRKELTADLRLPRKSRRLYADFSEQAKLCGCSFASTGSVRRRKTWSYKWQTILETDNSEALHLGVAIGVKFRIRDRVPDN